MKYSSKQYAMGLYLSLKEKSLKNREDILNNFIKILRVGKDFKKIRFIEENFKKIEQYERGEMEAIVWTGMPISLEMQKKIKKFIADFFKKDIEKIKIIFEIDKNLAGGFKARIDDYLIDASVKNMLLKLKKNITN